MDIILHLPAKSLLKQALDNQKNLMRRITGEELTDGIDFELQYNQIRMNYDLSSTFSATNNKVALYLKSNNITYKSNVDSKNVYRTQLVNNILTIWYNYICSGCYTAVL